MPAAKKAAKKAVAKPADAPARGPLRADYAPLSGYDVGDRVRRKVAEHVVRKAGLFPGERAFEAASGPALAGTALAKAFTRCRVSAADPRAEAVAKARANARADGAAARLDVVQAEPAALPYKDETFVYASAVLALSTLEDPEEAVAEIHRVTMFYGKILFVDVDFTRAAKKPRGVARRVLDEDLEEAMREMGYGKIQRQKIEILPGGVVLEGLSAKRFDPDDPEGEEAEDEDDDGDEE